MVVRMFILVFLASKVAVAFCRLILHYIRPGRLLALISVSENRVLGFAGANANPEMVKHIVF